MAVLVVPPEDAVPWPTLGPQLCDFLEKHSIFGPGSLKGERYRVNDELRGILYAAYEVYPKGHRLAGRRRYKRVGYSVRKGLAKTEGLGQVAYAELHPEAPVRCDGFDRWGRPIGRPVADPYIPLLSYQKEQVEELAYGALYVICTEGPDAELFDSSLERIIRLSPGGYADGRCVPIAGSPGARDGARTTFQGFDEPHRMILPRLIEAHETMVANLEKRPMEDPWGFYVGTAGEPGQNSVAEGLHEEAEQIADGKIDRPRLFYFHRWADEKTHPELKTIEQRVAAITEATGPIGEFALGQFESIADQWDRPKADRNYLERVWLNRWRRGGSQAFDLIRWRELERTRLIPDGAFVTIGFDGARFRDSTGLVITDIRTGRQRLTHLWERPVPMADEQDAVEESWEVPEVEVTAAVEDLHKRYRVWRGYYDPPHWTETVGAWSGRWPDQVEEWWTHRVRPMAFAVKAYREAVATGAVTHEKGRPLAALLEASFDTHIAAAGRKEVQVWDDDQGELGDQVRMFVLRKIHRDRKFDAAMAAILSWTAVLDARRSGAKPRPRPFTPARIR